MSDLGPVIITAEMGKADQAWADKLRSAHFPHERNFLAAHITLFHHLPPAQLPEIKTMLSAIATDRGRPAARLSDVMNLGRGVAFRIESPALLLLREQLAERFFGLLTPQDRARPQLHITVQNKVDPKTARALQQELTAQFKPRPIEITALAAHHYQGGPWQPIGRWPFRGNNA